MAAVDTLSDLTRRNPEWAPWLAVVAPVLAEIGDPTWDAAVPVRPVASAHGIPLLAAATLRSHQRVGSLCATLRQSAVGSGAPTMAGLLAMACNERDACAMFGAALNGDDGALGKFAADAGVDLEVFRAVAALLPMPFLHACARRWSSTIAQDWSEGYCPCCGAWPAFAENCGVERRRYLRCGRCGSAWQVSCLACPYCGMTDHRELTSLVPEQSGSKSAIEVCKGCLGYVKVATVLQPSSPATVMLHDLASVEFDLVATERGYTRPQGVGYALNVMIVEDGALSPRQDA